MGCNCNKNNSMSPADAMDLNTRIWGPIYWTVLHTLTELTGRKTTVHADSEESYLWDYILRELGDVLPCNECRKHYREYYSAHMPFFINATKYEEKRNKLREWLYNLHASTPRLADCPVPTLEELPEKYSLIEINLNDEIRKMYEIFNAGVSQGIIYGMKMFTFKSKIELLKIILM
jgi:hypothetical protein